MSLIFSGSMEVNVKYSVKIEPKIETEIPVTMMVLVLAPSQTIRSGARADFGRLFKMTKYGSSILDRMGKRQSRIADSKDNVMTNKKLKKVSDKVMII